MEIVAVETKYPLGLLRCDLDISHYSPGEIPSFEPFGTQTLTSSPLSAIYKWREVNKVINGNDSKDPSNLKPDLRSQGRCGKIKNTAGDKNSKIESGEIVMEEELALHEEKREVVQSPTYDQKATNRVVLNDATYKRLVSVVATGPATNVL